MTRGVYIGLTLGFLSVHRLFLDSNVIFLCQVSQQQVPPLGASICRNADYNSAWGAGGASPDALHGLVVSL